MKYSKPYKLKELCNYHGNLSNKNQKEKYQEQQGLLNPILNKMFSKIQKESLTKSNF